MAIKILDNQVIDQIAAGEVVERPAHLIKEIVENSLDAGASEITIDFKNGGRSVCVEDNGHGIAPEELPLALARHATSKIQNVHDIWRISSFGFRGEALASIAAVSRLTLRSRVAGQEMGHQITAEYGDIGAVQPIGGAQGTTLLIEGLFENVPARLKFLKSDTGEAAAIKTQLKALALARPDVTFRVRYNDDFVFYWPGVSTFLKRVMQVLNEEEMYEADAELDGVRVHAVVSSPNRTVGNSRQIWSLVQKRHVQDRGIQAAVLDAYRQLLMHGEYPVVAIDLVCPPDFVDVNVSPTKSQVKFQDASKVFRVVHRAVRGVLEKAPWRPAVTFSPAEQPAVAANVVRNDDMNERPQINLTFADSAIARVQSPERLTASEIASSVDRQTTVADFSNGQNINSTAIWSTLEVLGQSNLTYILCQSRAALLIVDQHAAHERVLFERLMRDIRAGSVEVQNFLLPQTVDLAEDMAQDLMKSAEEFQKLGFILEMTGPSQIAIQAAPALMNTDRLPAVIEKIAEDFVQHGGSFHLDKALGNIVATMACHSAIRAGQPLSTDEMRALLKQMDEFPLSSFCPHGRPVYVEYPFQRLERDFGRIV